jgi:hypothetical protein
MLHDRHEPKIEHTDKGELMIKDFMDFVIDAPANKDYVIEELISNDSGY